MSISEDDGDESDPDENVYVSKAPENNEVRQLKIKNLKLKDSESGSGE